MWGNMEEEQVRSRAGESRSRIHMSSLRQRVEWGRRRLTICVWGSVEVRLEIGQDHDGERVGRGGEGWGSSLEHPCVHDGPG